MKLKIVYISLLVFLVIIVGTFLFWWYELRPYYASKECFSFALEASTERPLTKEEIDRLPEDKKMEQIVSDVVTFEDDDNPKTDTVKLDVLYKECLRKNGIIK